MNSILDDFKSLSLNNDNVIIHKPFLKWIGGKTQIIDDILSIFPKQINNYYEPFLGGGSVLFGLLSYIKNNKIIVTGSINVSDINKDLINVYINIQNRPNELINEINSIKDTYNNIKIDNGNKKPTNYEDAILSKESYYYWMRNKYNNLNENDRNSVIASAIFIFLNKTCFRGMHRVGPNGFNVPYGNYKNPSIIDDEHILSTSHFIKDVKFTSESYSSILNNMNNNDFIYLDPPYVPINNKSFVGYNQDGFDEKEHDNLFEVCNRLPCKFLMSNADSKIIYEKFENNTIKIDKILCKRAINSKKPSSTVNELLIKNY